MFEKIRKMKNQKGFTLVELIVVLVILAILAALLVPALTGYIDKANKEKVIATTRMVVMAAQTEASEKYGLKASGELSADIKLSMTENGNTVTCSPAANATTGTAAGEKDGINIGNIAILAEVAKDTSNNATPVYKFVNGVTEITVEVDTKGHVTAATVTQSGFTCTYKATPDTGKDKYEVKTATANAGGGTTGG